MKSATKWQQSVAVAALCAVGSLASGPVLAEVDMSGFYMGATAGFQDRSRSAESDIIWTDWESGSVFSAHGGYRFNNRFRMDLEWARFKNDADVVSGGVTPDGFQLVAPGSGDAVLNTVFINANVDFEITPKWTLTLGGGVGRMKSELNNLTNDLIEGGGFIFDGTSEDWINTWQFKAGVGYRVTDNFEIFGMYRHVDAGKLEFVFHLPNGITFPAAPKETKIDSGEIGFRYFF
jgi:opacity protein-like surface antigen